jgi:2-amino-4-hydroxy-6-hydroxymethyldihydropteridine diphosphokinase
MKERIFLGLGSNLGHREENLRNAVRLISETSGLEVKRRGSVLETAAVDFTDQPDFLNQVILCESGHDPMYLLRRFQQIEGIMGREESFPKGPRLIDIDILLYGGLIMETPELVIPHPGIVQRWFVLVQLTELDPELADPAAQKKYSEVLDELRKKH